MGGRIAEDLVFGVISTGANNDLVGATELARKMVREWGMSERVGPMAWGSQGQVFLGEDLMHTRDYSDDTARVIDEEVERILREQEDRCRSDLLENRKGLDLVARALLEHETIDGAEVTRLIELARNGSGPAPTSAEATTAGHRPRLAALHRRLVADGARHRFMRSWRRKIGRRLRMVAAGLAEPSC